jgi:outer membrane protein
MWWSRRFVAADPRARMPRPDLAASPARRSVTRLATILLFVFAALAGRVYAQTIEGVTFDEAIRRAVTNNPSIQQATAGILRAESLLQQSRAPVLPTVNANLTTSIIGPVPSFAGQTIVPRSQLNTSLALGVPVLTPVRWAQRTQAADQVTVSQRTAEDVRREIAVATAQAYLAIIAQKRVLELNERARDNARAHFDYAQQRFEGGLGSRLNALRAQQELSSDEARVEDARLAVRRAQEALGVLVASDGPIDAATEPAFEVPQDDVPDRQLLYTRTDLRMFLARESAAERVVRDSWREYLPSVTTLFAPQVLAPSGLFAPARSWSVAFVAAVPIWEAGERGGRKRERQAALDSVRAERANVERQAMSDVRTARAAVQSTERALASARAAAQQAEEVVRITDVAFRAGATTNIEVIDAQRRARDAETAAAIAEDAVRRARLELLVATGRFPR